MRATLSVDVICPGCSLILYNESKRIMSCQNKQCKYYGVKLKRPSINLRLAGGQ